MNLAKLSLVISLLGLIAFSSGCIDLKSSSASSLSSGCSIQEKISFGDDPTSVTKGAQSFEVLSSNSMGKFMLKLSSAGVTRINYSVYSGGSTPEAGALVASGSVTSGLGSSTRDWVEFPFASVQVNPGVTYWFVFESVGAPVEAGSSYPFDSYSGGSFWSSSGSGWNVHWSEDLAFGGGFGC